MTTLFSILERILSTTPFANDGAMSLLNDEDAIIKLAEKMDVEIDSDQAIQIQNVGLQWVQQIQSGADQTSCKQQAKQALDG